MKDKLVSRLKKTLIDQQIKYISFFVMKTYLQSLDDDQRTMLVEKKRRKKYEQIRKQIVVVSIKSYVVVVAAFYKAFASVSTLAASAVTIVLRSFSSAETSSNACWNCHKTDHFAKKCKESKRSEYQAHINAMKLDVVESSDDDSKNA